MNAQEIANHITHIGDDGHSFFNPVFKDGVTLERDWVESSIDARADSDEVLRRALDEVDIKEVAEIVFNQGLDLVARVIDEEQE